MTDNPLCFLDVETTGLDPRIHQPYEVSWWHEQDDEPHSEWMRHTLEHAEMEALRVGRYFERGATGARPGGYLRTIDPHVLAHELLDVTIVGCNPGFDASMLRRYIGTEVWHYRLINVADVAMTVFDWDRPRGMQAIAIACRDRGFVIPEPIHTAESDVRALRASYYALRQIRSTLS